MRRIFGLLLALTLTGLTRAADEPRHNKLTPQEAADGWLLLFDGETTFGWHSPNGSKWTVKDGMLAPQSDKHGLLVSTTVFTDFDLKFQFRTRDANKAAVFFKCDADGHGAEKIEAAFKTETIKEAPGQAAPRRAQQIHLQSYGNQWMEGTIEVRNNNLINADFFAADTAVRFARVREPMAPPGVKPPPREAPGHIALSGNGIIFRDIRLKPVLPQRLFNGKDLTGWNEYKGTMKKVASTFAVNREGSLTIKNGPGDIQTAGQWADFVLQLDCKTNGKNLNSGVFFRCRPGEYQQGYEAQIHNGWTDKPKEYVVEDYDPKTHMLKEKRKVQSLSMDYGTGAIYRRIPARKEVAKDNEWFKMTILAEGNHLATWVNGVQVVDWTDNRPLADNARNGCRLEKGPISLQGHDPTTDLAFRNIYIEDLKAGKVEKP